MVMVMVKAPKIPLVIFFSLVALAVRYYLMNVISVCTYMRNYQRVVYLFASLDFGSNPGCH